MAQDLFNVPIFFILFRETTEVCCPESHYSMQVPHLIPEPPFLLLPLFRVLGGHHSFGFAVVFEASLCR